MAAYNLRLVFIFILLLGPFAEVIRAEQPKRIAYLTSWGLPNDAPQTFRNSLADAYMLSFARWDKNGQITSSDGLLDVPQKMPRHVPLSYLTWTQIAHKSPQTKILVSFGGQDYDDIWNLIDSDGAIDRLANNITLLLNTDFPVYTASIDETQACDSCDYKLLGHTQLAGVDFDFEQSTRLSERQNTQLTKLVKKIRSLIGDSKLIALTTYHVGADPAECRNPNYYERCSFTNPQRSVHHGEVRTVLTASLGLIDFYNVMTYDAGRGFDYQTSLRNYAAIIKQPQKLKVGISINRQWGPSGGFVMPHKANIERIEWQKRHGFGGFFVWALGASTEIRSLQSQIELFNHLASITDD